MKKLLVLLSIIAVALASCTSSSGGGDYKTKNLTYIFNQGNYTEQNGEISIYEEETSDISNRVFSQVNRFDLGAIIMDAVSTSAGTGFLICANPDKIIPVNLLTVKAYSDGIKQGVSNPRNAALAGNNYLCVTNAGIDVDTEGGTYDYTNGTLAVYSVNDLSYLGSVTIGANVQGVVTDGEQTAYVAYKDGIAVVQIDGLKVTETYVDDTYTGSPKQIVRIDEKLYISYPYEGIVVVDPDKMKCVARYNGPIDYDGILVVDAKKNLYTLSTTYNPDYTVSSSKVYMVKGNGDFQELYSGEHVTAFSVIPFTNHPVVAECNDYVTNSTIKILDADGRVLDSKSVGIGAFKFIFCTYLSE